MPENTFGDFLRHRREQLRPADVGLTSSARRRTPGLRREEVAGRAGISVDHYARLEQGRGRRPTVAVLAALARALLLTEAEHGYLHRLVLKASDEPAESEPLDDRARLLLGTMDRAPAVVVDRRYDLLAWNGPADTLFGGLVDRPGEQRNLLWLLFCDPGLRQLLDPVDADRMGTELVGSLRAHAERLDPALERVIRRLAGSSAVFRKIWPRHRFVEPGWGSVRIRHQGVERRGVGEVVRLAESESEFGEPGARPDPPPAAPDELFADPDLEEGADDFEVAPEDPDAPPPPPDSAPPRELLAEAGRVSYAVLGLPESGQRMITFLAPPGCLARRAFAAMTAGCDPRVESWIGESGLLR
ncbi:hypothetical protein C1701_05265 [Actinoalloteichus sp. AHMU CJ021]|uniref:helix-turn-helix domain-containing protein n=1 Tax=Actinoalloteichus TaxID=65496 RepID=UPI000CA03155|nr:hypothetical protein C1701_05265 [Actinoalloteichus sp. AHMU CJ021]